MFVDHASLCIEKEKGNWVLRWLVWGSVLKYIVKQDVILKIFRLQHHYHSREVLGIIIDAICDYSNRFNVGLNARLAIERRLVCESYYLYILFLDI